MKRNRQPANGNGGTAPLTLQDLLSYKIIAVANVMSAGSALRLREEFDLSLGEWRALALIAASASHSLGGLARAANLDKGQMSRVISALVKRGLVTRQPGARKGLVVHLSLTAQGRKLYTRLIAISAARNDRFAACLTPRERAALATALPKLFETARQYVRASPSTPAEAADAAVRTTRKPRAARGEPTVRK